MYIINPQLQKIQFVIFHADKLDECPEEIRPKTVMRFEDVIPISARNVKEIDKVKQSVRKVLDNEAEQKLEEIDKEAVYAKLREVGPRVN